jgi:hypothetical protein
MLPPPRLGGIGADSASVQVSWLLVTRHALVTDLFGEEKKRTIRNRYRTSTRTPLFDVACVAWR